MRGLSSRLDRLEAKRPSTDAQVAGYAQWSDGLSGEIARRQAAARGLPIPAPNLTVLPHHITHVEWCRARGLDPCTLGALLARMLDRRGQFKAACHP